MQLTLFKLAVRLASLGVRFAGGSVRTEREEPAAVIRTRSMMARKAGIIPVRGGVVRVTPFY